MINPSTQEEITLFPIQPEVVEIQLNEQDHPVAFREAVLDLMNSGMSEEKAREVISTTPIQLELAYSSQRGLFAVDTESVESLADDLFDPYTGKNVHVEVTND